MPLDESTFETIAAETLERFMDAIEGALGDVLDVDLQGGILTIELDSGGQYVINKHGPNRQIWMSSPFSGASHYDYDGETGGWVSTRDGTALAESLAGELAKAAGRAFKL